jgi:hypothetical protein
VVGFRRWCLVVAVVAGGCCAWSAVIDVEAFLQSYLVAFLFWWLVSLGSLATLAIYYLTGGRWGLAARPLLECGVMTLPLVAVAFLPIALQLPHVYPWANAGLVEQRAGALLASTQPLGKAIERASRPPADVARLYLNPAGYWIRGGVYFAVWLFVGYALCRPMWPRARRSRGRRRLAAAAIVASLLGGTFAAIDWAMSLDPGWYSTIYGVLLLAGGALAALSLATACAAQLQSRVDPAALLAQGDVLADLATMTMAYLMFWAYLGFSQFLIIWSGNLPEENVWYLARLSGGWQWVALAVVMLGFAAPFALLLSRDLKHDAASVTRLMLALAAMQLVALAWLVLPSFRPAHLWLQLADFAAPLALGGVWLAGSASLLVRRLPALEIVVGRET